MRLIEEYFEKKRKDNIELLNTKKGHPVLEAYMSGCCWMIDEIKEEIIPLIKKMMEEKNVQTP